MPFYYWSISVRNSNEVTFAKGIMSFSTFIIQHLRNLLFFLPCFFHFVSREHEFKKCRSVIMCNQSFFKVTHFLFFIMRCRTRLCTFFFPRLIIWKMFESEPQGITALAYRCSPLSHEDQPAEQHREPPNWQLCK